MEYPTYSGGRGGANSGSMNGDVGVKKFSLIMMMYVAIILSAAGCV